MGMKLEWHIPNCMDAEEEAPVEFNSIEEFYAIPDIMETSQKKGFIRWSISEEHLMSEYRDESFWVVASFNREARKFMKGILPKFVVPIRREVERINRQLPSCIVPDTKTQIVGKQIAEARAVGENLEFRFVGETEWTSVSRDVGIVGGVPKDWESYNRPSPACTAVATIRRVNGVMQVVEEKTYA